MEPLTTAEDSASTQLRHVLAGLRHVAGSPAVRGIARATSLAPATVQSALRAPERSSWVTISTIAADLTGRNGGTATIDMAELRGLFRAARAEWEGRPRLPEGAGAAYLVLDPVADDGPVAAVLIGDGVLADRMARQLGGTVVVLPILADYRRPVPAEEAGS